MAHDSNIALATVVHYSSRFALPHSLPPQTVRTACMLQKCMQCRAHTLVDCALVQHANTLDCRGAWFTSRSGFLVIRLNTSPLEVSPCCVCMCVCASAQVMKGPLADLFDHSQLLTDVSGSGNNWAHGYCTYGPMYEDAITEQVHRAVEACDSPQVPGTPRFTPGRCLCRQP